MEFARQGARVAICARSEQLETTADESLVEATLDRFGQIDVLIINAGGSPPGSFLSLTPEDWEAAVNLTLMSAVRLCYAVVPHMLERGSGSIVATQSTSVKEPIDNLILSNSLRMAVIGLMKSLANELGPKGIRVNTINPVWIWTERIQQLMADRAARNQTTVEEEAAEVTTEIPLGRMGTVEEYGRAIVFLASPAASFIHGHALMFDGGTTKAAL
jgi:3-oxoacyl-[acyl-carrier protein] reductase